MWISPSRSRPHNIARLIEACRATKTSTPFLICIDADDPLRESYLALDLPDGWAIRTGPRDTLSAIYNAALSAHPGLDWYGVVADDIVPETPGWDRILIATAGRDGLAYGDDGINGARHATHFVLGGDLVRSTGFLALPGLDRIYIDTCWVEIANRFGVLRYRPDVKLTHKHFSNGTAPFDAVYRKHRKDQDRQIFEAWRQAFQSQHRQKETL